MDENLSSHDTHIKAEAWFSQGVVLGKRREFKQALAYFDKAIELNPKYINAWYNKGVLYVQMEKYLDAIQHFNRILVLEPHYLDAWVNKALILELLGDKSNSEEAKKSKYQESMNCLDHSLEVYADLASSTKKQNTHYYNMIHSIWNHKGFLLHKVGKYNEAIECFEHGLSINPDDYHTWNNQGILHLNQNQLQRAKECFEKAIEVNTKFIPAWVNRALIYKKENRMDESLLVGMFVNLFTQNPEYSLEDLRNMIRIQRPFLTSQQKKEFLSILNNIKRLFSFNPGNKKFFHNLMFWVNAIPTQDG